MPSPAPIDLAAIGDQLQVAADQLRGATTISIDLMPGAPPLELQLAAHLQTLISGRTAADIARLSDLPSRLVARLWSDLDVIDTRVRLLRRRHPEVAPGQLDQALTCLDGAREHFHAALNAALVAPAV